MSIWLDVTRLSAKQKSKVKVFIPPLESLFEAFWQIGVILAQAEQFKEMIIHVDILTSQIIALAKFHLDHIFMHSMQF